MKEIPLRMAKATQKDLDCATLVIGMIDDIERGNFPRKADGEFDEADPDYFEPSDAEDCKIFVQRLLAVVGKREHGGCLSRVVFGMITALGNDMFDPEKDYLDWHPDLVPAVLERQRRKQKEEAGKLAAEPEKKDIPASLLQGLRIFDLQLKFRLGYVAAERLFQDFMPLAKDAVYHCREDEMLIFHLDGKYHATVYTPGPDCAVAIDEWMKAGGKEPS